ncbi:MAG: GNAT family N-acetyltransferase [Nibricoccus sp.]
MKLIYETSRSITSDEFIDLLKRAAFAERRPVEDRACIEAMLKNAGILCTAWDGGLLVGIARSVTDFSYCCYLSDLAVAETHQHHGIGRELIRLTQKQLGPRAKIILLAAPKAEGYYPKIGFTAHKSAWLLPTATPI